MKKVYFAVLIIFALLLAFCLSDVRAQTTQTIHSARLSALLSERERPLAEECIGFKVIAIEAYAKIAAVPCLGDGIIDDGVVGQGDFTRAHYRAVRDLLGMVASLNQNTTMSAALARSQVRSVGLLVPALPTPDGSTTDSLATNLKFVIRPLAPRIRALNARIRDGDRVVLRMLAPYQDGDVIDDGRRELGPPRVRVGDVRLLQATLSAMRAGTSTDCDDAVDAACTGPMRAE